MLFCPSFLILIGVELCTKSKDNISANNSSSVNGEFYCNLQEFTHFAFFLVRRRASFLMSALRFAHCNPLLPAAPPMASSVFFGPLLLLVFDIKLWKRDSAQSLLTSGSARNLSSIMPPAFILRISFNGMVTLNIVNLLFRCHCSKLTQRPGCQLFRL